MNAKKYFSDDGIEDFLWLNKGNLFQWSFAGRPYHKQFNDGLQSVIVLRDQSGFAVVGSFAEFGMCNAFILNATGGERNALSMPAVLKAPLCFHEIYYILDELTAIVATKSRDFACVVDPQSGLYRRIYEMR